MSNSRELSQIAAAVTVDTSKNVSIAEKITVTKDSSISGLTVGKGGGGVSSNTAVGASTLAANTSGANNTAFGSGALPSVTTSSGNTAVGRTAMNAVTSGSNNTAVGYQAMQNSDGVSNNTAVGQAALISNVASNNTAVGYQAGYSNTTGDNQIFIGLRAGLSVTTGTENTIIGADAGYATTTGSYNVALGKQALRFNTTASNNTAVGYQAGYANTTGASNVFVGYQAGYTNAVGALNTFVGFQAGIASVAAANGYNVSIGSRSGQSMTTATQNTLIGDAAGQFTTGSSNTFVGQGSGYSITTGTNNTVIGIFPGNQGGLDIRTASNYIVLSDGDGNPYAYWGATGQATFRTVGVDNLFTLTSSAGAFSSRINLDCSAGGGGVLAATQNVLTCITGGTGGVSLSAGATAWVSASDERVKENLVPITDAANKVASLRAVTGNYTWDESKKSRAFLIAQDVLEAFPQAVETKNLDELGLAYTDVIPLLVAAIKELKAEIDQLKGN